MLLAFPDPPVFPVMDPNYFDVQLPLDDPYYQMVSYSNMMVNGVATDPAVQAFLVAENLTVYSEWPEVGGMAVQLPPGQTVLDAVANWVTEYPAVLLAVDPDALFESCGFPEDEPNDDRYSTSWHLLADNEDHLPDWYGQNNTEQYAADVSSAWGEGESALGNGVVIAILDSGVDHTNPGLQVPDFGAFPPARGSSTWHGINIGDDKEESFQVGLRTEGFGDPWDWIMEKSQDYATKAGHGTCVAGIACAIADDDVADLGQPTDVLGTAPKAKYFPIALKFKGGKTTSGTITNAFSKLGGLKGIFPEDIIYDEVSDT